MNLELLPTAHVRCVRPRAEHPHVCRSFGQHINLDPPACFPPPPCPQLMDGLFARDPNGAMLAFGDMMRKQIVMPAHLMNDGQHEAKTGRNLFAVSRRGRKLKSAHGVAMWTRTATRTVLAAAG